MFAYPLREFAIDRKSLTHSRICRIRKGYTFLWNIAFRKQSVSKTLSNNKSNIALNVAYRTYSTFAPHSSLRSGNSDDTVLK